MRSSRTNSSLAFSCNGSRTTSLKEVFCARSFDEGSERQPFCDVLLFKGKCPNKPKRCFFPRVHRPSMMKDGPPKSTAVGTKTVAWGLINRIGAIMSSLKFTAHNLPFQILSHSDMTPSHAAKVWLLPPVRPFLWYCSTISSVSAVALCQLLRS